ncbi:MAG: integration host factor subunit alpha [Thermodesulfobacteriota bacterium]
MTLTKADLTQKVYENHNLSKMEVAEAVETFLRVSKECLTEGEDLLLSRFGKFKVKDKKPRKGRNPQTGDELILDARRVVTCKPSGILRDRVNSG